MREYLLILLVFIASVAYGQKTTSTETYGVVILNGRVIDPGTMFDDVANVGIKDGEIAIITKSEIQGKETIDAKGHVVAPGFIDTHYHATDVFASKMAPRDGVTTGMDLEGGSFNVKDWYAEKAKTGWQVNNGTSAEREKRSIKNKLTILVRPRSFTSQNCLMQELRFSCTRKVLYMPKPWLQIPD